MKSTSAKTRAFMMADVLTGLAIVASLAIVLAVAVGRERAAEQKLADSRAAIRVAERAMLSLQRRQELPKIDGVALTVRKAARGIAPAGYQWITIDSVVRGRHATLCGLAPSQVGDQP